ncbi:hypothetical protein AAFF_G00250690 [Aldrovandia affinis]|uniref:Uncharacterized protein n=1 Tax=Aldrovandia affinis TaxID=143900 RepID=A0AAD7RCU6_9TELE|nr:hypothetical protein AAFF_G00250690 [Aldrovandia affinis]
MSSWMPPLGQRWVKAAPGNRTEVWRGAVRDPRHAPGPSEVGAWISGLQGNRTDLHLHLRPVGGGQTGDECGALHPRALVSLARRPLQSRARCFHRAEIRGQSGALRKGEFGSGEQGTLVKWNSAARQRINKRADGNVGVSGLAAARDPLPLASPLIVPPAEPAALTDRVRLAGYFR